MFKKILLVPLFLFLFLLCSVKAYAQITKKIKPAEITKGTILKEISTSFNDDKSISKITYKVKLENGKTFSADLHQSELIQQEFDPGDKVVISKTQTPSGTIYQIVDSYRLPVLLYFLFAFVVIAIIIVGVKGIGSLLGLGISLIVILYGIVPLILKGYDPLLVTVFFCAIILLSTTYLAHGISKSTTVALIASFISLLLTLGISYACIRILNLNGFGNENVFDLYFATGKAINAQGLLLSGIIIATVGALNDVTVTQAVTIFEMKKLDKKLSFLDLIKKGMNIGREHGASMVNTIVLAYAGSSLFLFIFFIVNPQKQPIWAILNNEFMVEEIVKSLGGTMGILLSVPIVTLLAAYFVNKKIL